jgi:hypothetical protein
MDFLRHRQVAQELIERLDTAYNCVGIQFIFVSMHDRRTQTLRLASTDHFIDDGWTDIKRFYHEVMPNRRWPDHNLWHLEIASKITLGSKTIETHVIHVVPPRCLLSSKNWNASLRFQKNKILELLGRLEATKVPFIFFCRFPKRSGASSDDPDSRVIAYCPREGAGEAFIRSDRWQHIIGTTNKKEVRDDPLVTPQKRPRPGTAQRSHNKKIKRENI